MERFCIELQYLPPLSVMAMAVNIGALVLEAQEHYQKSSFRNKARLCASEGYELLTVPLLAGKHNRKPVKEVEISYAQDWVSQHLKTVDSLYGKAPFYVYYRPELEEILRGEFRYLWELNYTLLQWIIETLELEVEISETRKWLRELEMIDKRDVFSPKQLEAGSNEGRIRSYPQIFEQKQGFRVDCSILDALFCVGRELHHYI